MLPSALISGTEDLPVDSLHAVGSVAPSRRPLKLPPRQGPDTEATADVKFRPADVLTCQALIDRRVLHDRQIVLKVISSTPRAELDVLIRVDAAITTESGQRRSGGDSLLFWHTAGTVADVIRRLVCAIGHQSDQISSDIWTVKTSNLV